MAVKRRGLSNSAVSMLLSDVNKMNPVAVAAIPEGAETQAQAPSGGVSQLPIEKLKRGQYQPRQHFSSESLQELADSIKAQGIIQPILVRKLVALNMYEIIAGERRWRAAQLAGLSSVPAIIREMDDEMAMAIALIENIQREDLNPVEEAMALSRLVEEFGFTQAEVAEKVGKSRTTVTNLLRVLNLSADVRLMLEQGKLELGHAKVLLALDSSKQSQIARIVSLRGLTVRETEDLVRRQQAGNPKKSRLATDPNVSRLQTDLAEKLSAKVKLHHAVNGRGKVVIHYNSLDELDGILGHIK